LEQQNVLVIFFEKNGNFLFFVGSLTFFVLFMPLSHGIEGIEGERFFLFAFSEMDGMKRKYNYVGLMLFYPFVCTFAQ
jgi:hypothetical protein